MIVGQQQSCHTRYRRYQVLGSTEYVVSDNELDLLSAVCSFLGLHERLRDRIFLPVSEVFEELPCPLLDPWISQPPVIAFVGNVVQFQLPEITSNNQLPQARALT